MFDPANPEAKHPSYDRLELLRQLPGDLLGGLPALLARKDVYFPREVADGRPITKNGITVDPYLNRLSRLTLFNMFKEGINDQLVGRVFARPLKWSKDTPPVIAGNPDGKVLGFVDDVDGKATNAHVFLRRRFRNAWAKGLDGVLVDYPPTADAGSRSSRDEKRAGLRPYWRPYASGAVWDWTFAVANGTEQLVYLKLRDTWTDPATGKKHPALRIFTADGLNFVRFEVWIETGQETKRPDGKAEYAQVFTGDRRPHFEIPFVPFATDGDEPMEAEPELIDAAYLNLAHCRKTGAVDNSQHQINFPMLAISGLTMKEAEDQVGEGVGSHRAWIIPQAGGGISHAEPSGTSWSAAEKTIESIERRIDRLIQKPLERDSAQPLTAQGEANSEAARLSRLEASVHGLTDSTNTLLYFTAIDYNEVKPGAEGGWGAAEYNTKWTAAQRDVDVVRFAYEQVAAGRWPERMAYTVAQRFGVAPEDLAFEEMRKMLDKEGGQTPRLFPVLLPLPSNGGEKNQPPATGAPPTNTPSDDAAATRTA